MSETNQRTILLYDQFGYDWWSGEGITAKRFNQELAECLEDSSCEEIIVAINSPGGSVAEGIPIYNAIVRHNSNPDNPPINTRNDGIAYSMGAIVLMAGKKVYAHSNTTMLIHNASGMAFGNARDMLSSAEMLNAVDKGISETIAEKTGLSKDEVIKQYFDYADHTYTANEAYDQGLIDEVINSKTEAGDMLKGKSIEEAFNMFRPQAQNKSILNKIRNFSIQTPKNHDTMKISLGQKALAALFNVAPTEDAPADFTMEDSHVQVIEDKLQELADAQEQLTAKDGTITQLQNEIQTLKDGATPPAGSAKEGDINPDGNESDTFLSETDAQIQAIRAEMNPE